MTNKIELQIDVEKLADAAQRILSNSGNMLHPNPLPKIIAECVTNAGDTVRATVDKLTREFVGSEEFARRIRQVYRDAMIGEAERMGRNAARAAVNAKETK